MAAPRVLTLNPKGSHEKNDELHTHKLELFRVARDNVSSRYTDNGNGTVTDNQHHLTWQQQDDGVGRNWSDAAAYCSSLSLAGYSDWWLPSKYQLVSLVDSSYSYPTINTNYFLNTQSTYYWSSTDHYFETFRIIFQRVLL